MNWQRQTTWSGLVVGLWMVCQSVAWAAPKVALVIGNSQYARVEEQLKNPVNDATAVAASLKNLGYQTTVVLNASLKQTLAAIEQSRAAVDKNGSFVFYYAGHGIQVDGSNYLVPIDADMSTRDLVNYQALRLQDIVGKISQSAASQQIFVIDACRNDPFPKTYRSAVRGLARESVNTSKDSMIMYSASAGEVAEDGKGRHGVFTEVLLNAMQQEGVTLPVLMDDIKAQVSRKTNGKQNPYYEGSGLSRFTFRQRTTPAPIPIVPPAYRDAINTNVLKDCENCPEVVKTTLIDSQRRPYTLMVGKYEVTKKQFIQFVEETNYNIQDEGCYVLDNNIWIKDGSFSYLNPSFVQNENHPVTCVSYEDASAYIKWLNQKSGARYRLPTTHEWNQIASAGTQKTYPTGSCITSQQANFDSRSLEKSCQDSSKIYLQKTQPVSSYQPNAWGIYNLAGNVSEWTNTCSPVEDSLVNLFSRFKKDDSCAGKKIYLKGGSWLDPARNLQIETSQMESRSIRRYTYGFRIVKETLTP